MFGKGWDREIDLLTTKEKIKIQNANPARAGQNDTCQGRQSSKFSEINFRSGFFLTPGAPVGLLALGMIQIF